MAQEKTPTKKPSVDSDASLSIPVNSADMTSSPGRNMVSSPVSGHRRSSSLASGRSSISGSVLNLPSNYTGSLSTSFSVPMGLNKLSPGQQDTLGANSIAELVDGSTGSGNASSTGGGGIGMSSPSAARMSIDGTPTRRPGVSSGHHITQPFKPPTSKDIPPVTLTPIKKVAKSQLNNYLNAISEDYDTFFEIKLSKEDSSNHGTNINTSNEEDTVSSVVTNEVIDDPNSSNERIIPPSANFEPELTPLSSIPDVFFEAKFQLDNPRTFDVVSENSDIVRQSNDEQNQSNTENGGRKILANNSILQEKLSWYIDTVELHLINEISNSSTSFFSALGDLKNIRKQAESCVERIERLRQDLKLVDEKRAVAGIENLKLKQRRENVSKLSQSLLQISTIMSKAEEAEAFLTSDSGREVTRCLDTIDATEGLISGNSSNELVTEWCRDWKHPIIDLKSLIGLSDLRENLCTLRNNVGENYSSSFIDILLSDLHRHMGEVPQHDTLRRLGKSLEKYNRNKTGGAPDNTSYLDVSPDFRASLEDNLHGLVRSDNILSAFKAYKDMVVKEAKNIVRNYLPSNRNDDNISVSSSSTNRSVADKSRALTTLLYEMSSEEAEEMVSGIYTTLSELFRRLLTQQKILLDITSSIIANGGSGSMPPIDLNDLLNNVIETSQKRMVKVLNARRNQTAQLGLQEFFNFYSLNAMFLSECEAIGGDPGVDLRACVSGQIKTFLTVYHKNRYTELTNLMEKDLWKEIEVTKEFQGMVDRFVSGADKDPEEWNSILKVILTKQTTSGAVANGDDGDGNRKDEHEEQASNNNNESASVSTKKLPRNVFVENNSFIIANAAKYTVEMSEGYLKLCVVLPHLSSEIIKNLNELIAKFNSNASDLILGTGAVRSAGLKHITAKHLALCHESLNLVVHLLPYIEELVKRHCSISSDVGKLDETKQDLTKHTEEIQSKMISLMSDRITGHCNSIKRIDWSKPAPSPCNKYMQDLVKEVSLLIKIVKNYMPNQIYLLVTSRIFDIYKRKVLEEYTKFEFKSVEEKKR